MAPAYCTPRDRRCPEAAGQNNEGVLPRIK